MGYPEHHQSSLYDQNWVRLHTTPISSDNNVKDEDEKRQFTKCTYGAKWPFSRAFGANWSRWTIFDPNDPTGPFIWYILQHTTTATCPIIANNNKKTIENSKKHENFSKSNFLFFLFSLKKPCGPNSWVRIYPDRPQLGPYRSLAGSLSPSAGPPLPIDVGDLKSHSQSKALKPFVLKPHPKSRFTA